MHEWSKSMSNVVRSKTSAKVDVISMMSFGMVCKGEDKWFSVVSSDVNHENVRGKSLSLERVFMFWR